MLFPGVQCTEADGVLSGVFAAKYGGPFDVWRFSEAASVRQKDSQPWCVGWFAGRAAVADQIEECSQPQNWSCQAAGQTSAVPDEFYIILLIRLVVFILLFIDAPRL